MVSRHHLIPVIAPACGAAGDGYKQSGVGRLRGPLAITEFQEAKTVVHAIPPFQR